MYEYCPLLVANEYAEFEDGIDDQVAAPFSDDPDSISRKQVVAAQRRARLKSSESELVGGRSMSLVQYHFCCSQLMDGSQN